MGILRVLKFLAINVRRQFTPGRRWRRASYCWDGYFNVRRLLRSQDLLAHTQHSVNFLDSKPVQNIGHQSLESHILHARNILCSLEILRGPVRSTLSGVVNKVLQQGIRKPTWGGQ
jgi:hypothetical protein